MDVPQSVTGLFLAFGEEGGGLTVELRLDAIGGSEADVGVDVELG